MTANSMIPLNQCTHVSVDELRQCLRQAIQDGAHLSALFVIEGNGEQNKLVAVLNFSKSGVLDILISYIGHTYPSLSLDCFQTHYFEREIFEQSNIIPEGHPWLKPVRFEEAYKKRVNCSEGDMEYYQIQGADVHEVAVGPVHAGVIEPGHFRFQCHGEHVFHLETSLGYQHRGIEKALINGPDHKTIHYIETVAGDSTIGHALAYAQVLEALCQVSPSESSRRLRCLAAELERLANHIGDLGALAGDIGFLTTMNYCGRIRGDVLNMTAAICGNRFGRGIIVPGGTARGLNNDDCQKMFRQLADVELDTINAVTLMLNAPSVLARLEGTGMVSSANALDIGLVGVAARASGVCQDIRIQYPYAFYDVLKPDVVIENTGDAAARANVRFKEILISFNMIKTLLQEGALLAEHAGNYALQSDCIALSLTEGWRGEICHVAISDENGRFLKYKIIDPSFHNWFGLAYAMRDQQISDFPLCNKSFNLSYCGHDL